MRVLLMPVGRGGDNSEVLTATTSAKIVQEETIWPTIIQCSDIDSGSLAVRFNSICAPLCGWTLQYVHEAALEDLASFRRVFTAPEQKSAPPRGSICMFRSLSILSAHFRLIASQCTIPTLGLFDWAQTTPSNRYLCQPAQRIPYGSREHILLPGFARRWTGYCGGFAPGPFSDLLASVAYTLIRLRETIGFDSSCTRSRRPRISTNRCAVPSHTRGAGSCSELFNHWWILLF